MSDAAFLYLVFVGLYVIECFAWVAENETLLVWRPWSGYVPTSPIPFLRNDHGGLAFTCLLPPIFPAFKLRSSIYLPSSAPPPVSSDDHISFFRQTYSQLRDRLRWLNLTSAAYWCYLLFVAPIDASVFGFDAIAPRLLLTIAVLATANAIAFAIAHHCCLPHERWSRIGHILKLLLFPPAAFRAPDIIARDALAIFHPLLVASEICRENTFMKIGGKYVRALVYPTTDERTDRQDAGQNVPPSSDLMAFVNRVLAAHDSSIDEMLKIGIPTDSALRYCPRCLSSFSLLIDQCPDCHGVKTKEIANPTVAKSPR